MERADQYIELAPDEWANLVVLAEDYGWKPELKRVAYLAPDTQVSAIDAQRFVHALQDLIDAALADPFSVYPIRARMDLVVEAEEFCSEGAFALRG